MRRVMVVMFFLLLNFEWQINQSMKKRIEKQKKTEARALTTTMIMTQ
jgi:hypothetical protein